MRWLKRAGIVVAVLVLVLVSAPLWKPTAKRFKWFVVATNVYQDTLRRTGLRADQISQPDYAAIPDSELPTYIDRINGTFTQYLKYGRLEPSWLHDARVLEVGPGATLGVALRMIGAGARQVVAVDKFVPLETSSFHRRLYSALAGRLSPPEQRNILDAVSLDDGVRFDSKRVSYIYGRGMEEVGAKLQPHSFDLIVSNAVIEEVYDLDRLMGVLDTLLKPGGRQVHVVDLRDYGMFTNHGFHPLEFLTIPDPIYRHMVEAAGQPNRRLASDYRNEMQRLGYRTTVFATWVVGGRAPLPEFPTTLQYGRDYSDENLQLVQSIRPRLLPRYRDRPDEELLTASILLVAEKPAAR